MCLGVPGRIVSIDGFIATVDFWGVQKHVQLHLVDEPVQPGDYILNHVGYAIRKIPAEDIEGTLAMYDQLLDGKPGDLMRADVEGELDAARGRR
ncbi:MAG: HypC/HybG/HupF family hydrogenase formation chaperone [Myxococcaceae bacterium]